MISLAQFVDQVDASYAVKRLNDAMTAISDVQYLVSRTLQGEKPLALQDKLVAAGVPANQVARIMTAMSAPTKPTATAEVKPVARRGRPPTKPATVTPPAPTATAEVKPVARRGRPPTKPATVTPPAPTATAEVKPATSALTATFLIVPSGDYARLMWLARTDDAVIRKDKDLQKVIFLAGGKISDLKLGWVKYQNWTGPQREKFIQPIYERLAGSKDLLPEHKAALPALLKGRARK